MKQSKNLNLVSYFGGKSQILPWLKPLLPVGDYHFVDAMCGAANVALNVDYPLITVNDINSEVINLFQVLREEPEEFTRILYFTAFSREELYSVLDAKPVLDRVEMARRFFVRCQLGYGANGSQNSHRGVGFEYNTAKSKYYRVDGWNFKIDYLAAMIEKFRRMQIEHCDVLELIQKMDRPKTIIYLDPPYVLSTRSSKKRYKFECSDDFHTQLLQKAKEVKHAYVAISGYENELYNKTLQGWFITKSPPNKSNTGKREVIECLWTNYDPLTVNGQLTIDYHGEEENSSSAAD